MLDTTEKLPLLRFVKTAEEDRIATEQAEKASGKKRTEYMDVVKVYIRAAGDLKTEVVDIAEKTAYDVSEATVDVEKNHTVMKEVDGEMKRVTQKAVVPEVQRFFTPKIVTPWLDKQKQRLHHKKITQQYYDYCVDAFNRFKQNEDQPINGTPLAMWAGAPEAVKKKAIECGVLSVEAAAEMTTEAMNHIGMGAADLKKSAQAYVSQSNDLEDTVKALEAENKEKDDRLGALEAKLAELMDKQPAKRGRPKKEEAEAA